MCIGYLHIPCYFIQGTGVSINFGISRGSWNQSPVDSKGQLYFVLGQIKKNQDEVQVKQSAGCRFKS
jgi:hypothetical protein